MPRPQSRYMQVEVRPPDLERPDASLGPCHRTHVHGPTSLFHKPRPAMAQTPVGTDFRKSPHYRYKVTCDIPVWVVGGSGRACRH